MVSIFKRILPHIWLIIVLMVIQIGCEVRDVFYVDVN
jgi:hypothetical protein